MGFALLPQLLRLGTLYVSGKNGFQDELAATLSAYRSFAQSVSNPDDWLLGTDIMEQAFSDSVSYQDLLAGVSPPLRDPSGTYRNLEQLEKHRSVRHICHKAMPHTGFPKHEQCIAICLSRRKKVLRLEEAYLFPSLASPTAISRNAVVTGTCAV